LFLGGHTSLLGDIGIALSDQLKLYECLELTQLIELKFEDAVTVEGYFLVSVVKIKPVLI
jgi:hypothetical protein